jgi:hypothetical protein
MLDKLRSTTTRAQLGLLNHEAKIENVIECSKRPSTAVRLLSQTHSTRFLHADATESARQRRVLFRLSRNLWNNLQPDPPIMAGTLLLFWPSALLLFNILRVIHAVFA